MAVVQFLPSYFLIFILIFCVYTPCMSNDGVPLYDFKEKLDESASLDSTWIKGTDPCHEETKWKGVECNSDNVINLYLMNYGLSGDIAIDSLVNLKGLRVISLENNSFSGPLPSFNRLTALKSLYLTNNEFSGEIPLDFFSKMGSLKKLELARNKFSGRIPDSLTKLQNLRVLFLQQNEFTGPIPSLAQKSLDKIDLSNNKLQGEIPPTMSRFGTKPFEGNPNLCGTVLSKECKADDKSANEAPAEDNISENKESGSGSRSGSGSGAKWVVLSVVIALVVVTIAFKAKRKEDDFRMLGKENLDEAVQVHIPSSMKKRNLSSRKGNNSTNSSRKGSQRGGKVGDLSVINEEKGIFGLPDLMKAAAEVLGSGGLGSAYKAVMANGRSVVVKRLRDVNKVSRETFDTEIRKLGTVRHQNILTPLAYHYRKEEKLLVSEFVAKGSLLYLLHGDRGIYHGELNWPTRLKIIQGVAQGMGFLHNEFAQYELPHGNLKSSNILLSSDYEPLLNDYMLYPLISNTQSVQQLFAYKTPEAILYQQVSPKSDVFCLGVVILEIVTGKFPSQYLNNQKGGTDVIQWTKTAISENKVSELIDLEIANTSNSLDQMEKLLYIGAECTESDQDKRIVMKEAIKKIEEVQV
ncbi:pollen receptor-like kinase 3 [Olea europaea subsp. europaea]|uniref:Pollen receptor-like kinase 3 n=1 Tax=Olea europaea subsp. europaea TaxID=158383 RepID=A0A8S0U496_OLEEU|nr:pollen receptor-like kinase 3 [Olea europaea subsp. europaea]